MTDLCEFAEEYMRLGGNWTNRSIAEAYCEQNCEPGITDEEFEKEVDEIERQLPYYTGVGI